MKKTIIAVVLIIIIGLGIYLFAKKPATSGPDGTPTVTPVPAEASSTPVALLTGGAVSVIGKTIEGRDINAYHYGTGTQEVLFVGGIHGGYEWNTVLVAKQLQDYLKANPDAISSNVRVTVIPVLNPDGLNRVVGISTADFTTADVSSNSATVISGRFNGNNVDLNRNFDCDWQTEGKWQSRSVSGGAAPFSEPESQAIKTYVETNKPVAVIVWYSAAGGVFASNCHNGVSDETLNLTKTFATASGYSAHETFDFYSTTGDMTNWLAKINVPAISILLTNHKDTEWTKNLAGIKAVLKYYADKI